MTILSPTSQPKTIPEFLTTLSDAQIQLWVEEGRLRYRAPKEAMTAAIREQIAARKGEILHFMQNVKDANDGLMFANSSGRPDLLPLSFAQQRLWFLDQLEGPSDTYNISGALRIRGSLDATLLEAATNALVARHEILRTTFPTVDGEPVQRIAPTLTIPLDVIDLSHLATEEQEQTVRNLAHAEKEKPFDLVAGPLLRMTLLRLCEADTVPEEQVSILLSSIHHIIADGWSMDIFGQELVTLYAAFRQGKPSPLAPLPIQYADYAVWQRAWLSEDVLIEQAAYWQRQLAAPIPALALPTDRPRPPQQTFRGRRYPFTLPTSLTDELNALSQREGVTLFMTLLAGFQILLHWYSRQEEIVVGTDVANRQRTELEGLIGFFVNQLVLRTDLRDVPSVRTLLARVKEVTLGAYAHQDLPFDKLVEVLNPPRDNSRSPLFQVKLVLQNAPVSLLELAGLQWEPLALEGNVAKFDLLLDLWEETGTLHGEMEYNRDLFDATTIEQMMRHYELLLSAIVSDPDAQLDSLCSQLDDVAIEAQMQEKQQLQAAGLRKLQKRRTRTGR